ncbi:umecyanin-like [Rhodamnia argentea]|uniref:Umecyanin-like n=1 Tax=Rhodamnia argentea TaxID=178133 RepID=A0ABM3HCA7_9MYRT|nr:umecyanin-like [Rhodamnia argentea]
MARDRAMHNLAGRALAIAVVEILAMLRSMEAASYTVGDSAGWSTPGNGASFYSSWASGHTFRVGDVLVFNFIDGQHSVAVVSPSDFNSCNTASPIALLTSAPVDYTINTTGTFYFICTHDSHCSQGQKLAVTAGTASGPTTSPPGTTTPPPPPPPGHSGTGYLYASDRAVFASVALYFLMM